MSTVITTKGRVTLPKKVRDYLGIRPGDAVNSELTADGRVVLVKAAGSEARAASPFARIRGSGTAKMSTDEIMALTRGDA